MADPTDDELRSLIGRELCSGDERGVVIDLERSLADIYCRAGLKGDHEREAELARLREPAPVTGETELDRLARVRPGLAERLLRAEREFRAARDRLSGDGDDRG